MWASLVAQTVKNLPTIWETWVGSLGPDDPLEEEIATRSSILAWRIPDKSLHRLSEKAAYMGPLCLPASARIPRYHQAVFQLSRPVVLDQGEPSFPPRKV